MPGISKTVVSLQPGKMEEVSKFLDAQSGAVTELDGMIGFAVAVTGEDEITLIVARMLGTHLIQSRQYLLIWLLSWPLHRKEVCTPGHGSPLNSLIV